MKVVIFTVSIAIAFAATILFLGTPDAVSQPELKIQPSEKASPASPSVRGTAIRNLVSPNARVRVQYPTAVVDGMEVKGKIVVKKDGKFARLLFHNPTEKEAEITVHIAAFCTPGASPFSRMVLAPRLVKADKLVITLPPLRRFVKHVRITKEQQKKASPAKKAKPVVGKRDLTAKDRKARKMPRKMPDSWALMVSRSPVKKANGWGATIPPAKDGKAKLGKGRVMLFASPLKHD